MRTTVRFSSFCLGLLLWWSGSQVHAQQLDAIEAMIPDGNTIPPLAYKHCSSCHLPPRPGSMTQKTWDLNFAVMTQIMREKNLPVNQPELDWLLRYYTHHSPVAFAPLVDQLAPDTRGFKRQAAGLSPITNRPEITYVETVDLHQDGKTGTLVCDSERGVVSYLQFRDGDWTETILSSIPGPAKCSVLDYEGDGDLDIAVAALGDIHPSDKLIGEAHLLVNRGDGTFEDWTLAKDLARVCDMQPGDFDGDGDTDFVIAKFGWIWTGGLIWLEQIEPTVFKEHALGEINGPMRLQVVDYEGDGDQDFVTLISQQHEMIVLFTNDGTGKFTSRMLVRANHPAYGSSSFQMVDLDQDGDLDILATNGDMMDDNPEWKPYHGARWFENVNGVYDIRPLVAMPGCYSAKAADMDGDGDLDVLVSNMNFFWEEDDFPCVLWLENDGKQNFTGRRVDYAPQNIVTSAVGDLNHDGIPDIVGGGMHVPGPLKRVGRLTVWLGETPVAEAP